MKTILLNPGPVNVSDRVRQGPLAAMLFRIATMGDVSEADYRRFLRALEGCVARA